MRGVGRWYRAGDRDRSRSSTVRIDVGGFRGDLLSPRTFPPTNRPARGRGMPLLRARRRTETDEPFFSSADRSSTRARQIISRARFKLRAGFRRANARPRLKGAGLRRSKIPRRFEFGASTTESVSRAYCRF